MEEEISQLESYMLEMISQSEEKMKKATIGSGEATAVHDQLNFGYGLGSYDSGQLILGKLYELFPQLKK